MKNLLLKLLVVAAIIFFTGCESSNDSSSDNSVPTEVLDSETTEYLDDSFYQYSSSSDENGIADLKEGLKALGYVDDNTSEKYVVEILNRDEIALANMDVSYMFDSKNVYLKIVDPNNNFNTLYQIKNYNLLEVMNIETNTSQQRFLPFLVRLIVRSFMRAKKIYTIIDGVDTAYSLYNLDISYESNDDELIFEGDISDFYTLFNTMPILKKVPFVYGKNIKKSNQNISARGAIKFKDDVESIFPTYLKDITGYAASLSDIRIRVVLNKVDGKYQYATFEILYNETEKNNADTNIADTSESLYDVTVKIEGNKSFDFDVAGNAPDFKGWIVINTNNYTIVEEANSFSSTQIITNVRVSIGEKIEVMIIDEDILFDDEVSRFDFTFNGNKHIAKNDISTVTLDFDAVLFSNDTTDDSKDDSSIYDMDVNIQGFDNYNYGLFDGLPDFKGSIIIQGKNFEIIEKANSLNNSQIFKDINIAIGDEIKVIIIDVDVIFDDDIIEFNTIFDGESISKSNDKVLVTINFGSR